MDQNELKREAAHAAIEYLNKNNLLEDNIIGVGTGSTVNYFIAELSEFKDQIKGAVSSSKASTKLLTAAGISVFDLKEVGKLSVYVDGADECNKYGHAIKGGGGALTCEKILANAADEFVLIIDESKLVEKLGNFPLPIEVIDMARSSVAHQLKKIFPRAEPDFRENYRTDNGHEILDLRNYDLREPAVKEQEINNIAGVVTNGIFAIRPADVILMATQNGVERVL